MSHARHPVVFLLGLHGSGKTTLGRHLQTAHGWRHISLGDLGRLARNRRPPRDFSLRLMCLLAGQALGAPLRATLVEQLLADIEQLRGVSPVSVDGFPSDPAHIALVPPGSVLVHLAVPEEERERRLAARSESGPRRWTPGLLSERDLALPSVLSAAGSKAVKLDATESVEFLAASVSHAVETGKAAADRP